MQMSKRVNKTKHTIRPVAKPAGKPSRFNKPNKVKRRQKRESFTDLSQLKDKMEEQEMRMGGTSANAAKIIQKTVNESSKEAVITQPLLQIVEEIDDTINATLEETAQILDTALDVVDDVSPTDTFVDGEEDVIEEDAVPTGYKVGLFGALRLGLRDTIMGQVVTAVMGR